MLRWLLELGIRRGELLGVRLCDVDFQKLEVFIARRADSKDDPSVPAGAVISISTPVMPSRLIQAIHDRQRLIELSPAVAPVKAGRRRRA